MNKAQGLGWRRPVGLRCAVVGLASLVVGLTQVPTPGLYAGGCTKADPSSGSCVIDELAGDRPATHGTVDYQVAGSLLTLDFSPVEEVGGMQVCLIVNRNQPNPFVPTKPSSCNGTSLSKVYDGIYQDPYTYDLTTLRGWIPRSAVWFAVGFGQQGMRTFIVGEGSSVAATTPPTTVGVGGGRPVAVTLIPSSDGAPDYGWLGPVGVLLLLVACKLLRLTAEPHGIATVVRERRARRQARGAPRGGHRWSLR